MTNKTDLIPLRFPPTFSRLANPNPDAVNTLRAYRASPETVNIQIRTSKGFANAAVSYSEAVRFADLIRQAADELPADVKTL